ncbi:recombination regulator RecX [Allorhizobium taibaishanense]|uniref:Regulatory protein RecX n=1 Tax=Allorhizobium taibaishanense TaxID=887144 RepID=A0A1Q9A636_9HYPH|nr:recombination regulator RecX [Allorhizobium taibaishanense]MBB4008861.1 regulatory protein [Allorhizobium taibaishanense]OLP50031.1 recombination regulator RecX [Allorhizobium taibaishanense]
MTSQSDASDEPPTDADPLQPKPRMLAWARNSAAYRLSRRMMSEQELRDAVSRKARKKYEEIEPETVAVLAEEAVRFGRQMLALDDDAYAQIKSQSAARSGKSKRAIAQVLQRKGIDRDIAQAALEEVDDLAGAIRFARKRGYGPFRRNDGDERQRNKELSGMARNGFGYDLAQKVLAMKREEAEELLLQQPL